MSFHSNWYYRRRPSTGGGRLSLCVIHNCYLISTDLPKATYYVALEARRACLSSTITFHNHMALIFGCTEDRTGLYSTSDLPVRNSSRPAGFNDCPASWLARYFWGQAPVFQGGRRAGGRRAGGRRASLGTHKLWQTATLIF